MKPDTKQIDIGQYRHGCAGFCCRCQTLHQIPVGPAKSAALELILALDREKRVDFHLPADQADARFSTDYLFGKARGKMFGVLVGRQADGAIKTFRAFSGQYNGRWVLEGWAPPLFDLQQWHQVNDGTEKEIKKLGMQLDALTQNHPQRAGLIQRRRNLSRELMDKLHDLYRLHNFRNQCRPLTAVFSGRTGIPNGTADCCGPKLLNWAAKNSVRPLGLAEFYYGRKNKQGNRRHGEFYPACRDKCAPILGYLLCGLDAGVKDAAEPVCQSNF